MKTVEQAIIISSLISTLSLPMTMYTPNTDSIPFLASKTYTLPIEQKAYQWENYNIPLFSEQYNSDIRMKEYFDTMNTVAMDLIQNSVDIDADIVKFVDEEFWNLI